MQALAANAFVRCAFAGESQAAAPVPFSWDTNDHTVFRKMRENLGTNAP